MAAESWRHRRHFVSRPPRYKKLAYAASPSRDESISSRLRSARPSLRFARCWAQEHGSTNLETGMNPAPSSIRPYSVELARIVLSDVLSFSS